jgi:hypothetical protein
LVPVAQVPLQQNALFPPEQLPLGVAVPAGVQATQTVPEQIPLQQIVVS